MAFHEVRFPDNISRGARGGPERRTQIVELASGDEERNASWANSRRRYDVAYGIRRADDLAAVVAFFEARNGRLHGFRFKDWGDHKSCLPSGTPSPTDQAIGTGDGTTTAFQLVKRYASGAQSWTRAIAKPVVGSVRIALGGVEQPSGWSVDTTTGVVTLSAAPGSGVAITSGFEFDVPVRFDTDVLDVTLDLERLGSITSIPLLETAPMKTLAPALQAHLDEGTTTLAWCWRIARADGVSFGFTDHDRTLSFDGTDFEPESGLTASEVRSGSDLSVECAGRRGRADL